MRRALSEANSESIEVEAELIEDASDRSDSSREIPARDSEELSLANSVSSSSAIESSSLEAPESVAEGSLRGGDADAGGAGGDTVEDEGSGRAQDDAKHKQAKTNASAHLTMPYHAQPGPGRPRRTRL
jgi:hypothetical protein